MKLYWRVGEPLTGRYRAFFRRSWPRAYFDAAREWPAVMITCEDSYAPWRVKKNIHSELVVSIAVWRARPGTTDTFDWRRLKSRATTLAEAKQLAAGFFAAHPQYVYKGVGTS